MTIDAEPRTPTENVVRGALFALPIIPVGAAVWAAIWSAGFVVSIVAFGAAFGAAWLYGKGAGMITKAGAFVILGVVVVTLLLSFWAGFLTDALRAISEQTGRTWFDLITLPEFWTIFRDNFWAAVGDQILPLLLAVAFGVLGCARILARTFRVAAANGTPPAGFSAPQAPTGFGAAPAPTGVDPVGSTPAAPPAAPPAQPQTGIVLNGEPLDPEKS